MKRVLFACLSAVLFSLSLPMTADAQGVWQQLEDTARERPAQQMPHSKTLGELCNAAEKCRSHFLAKGYAVQWRGEIKTSNHPLDLELLVVNEAAVLCFGQPGFPDSDWVQCLPMRKVN